MNRQVKEYITKLGDYLVISNCANRKFFVEINYAHKGSLSKKRSFAENFLSNLRSSNAFYKENIKHEFVDLSSCKEIEF
jgi:hypothetical protein